MSIFPLIGPLPSLAHRTERERVRPGVAKQINTPLERNEIVLALQRLVTVVNAPGQRPVVLRLICVEVDRASVMLGLAGHVDDCMGFATVDGTIRIVAEYCRKKSRPKPQKEVNVDRPATRDEP
jgi:hypothetical protein